MEARALTAAALTAGLAGCAYARCRGEGRLLGAGGRAGARAEGVPAAARAAAPWARAQQGRGEQGGRAEAEAEQEQRQGQEQEQEQRRGQEQEQEQGQEQGQGQGQGHEREAREAQQGRGAGTSRPVRSRQQAPAAARDGAKGRREGSSKKQKKGRAAQKRAELARRKAAIAGAVALATAKMQPEKTAEQPLTSQRKRPRRAERADRALAKALVARVFAQVEASIVVEAETAVAPRAPSGDAVEPNEAVVEVVVTRRQQPQDSGPPVSSSTAAKSTGADEPADDAEETPAASKASSGKVVEAVADVAGYYYAGYGVWALRCGAAPAVPSALPPSRPAVPQRPLRDGRGGPEAEAAACPNDYVAVETQGKAVALAAADVRARQTDRGCELGLQAPGVLAQEASPERVCLSPVFSDHVSPGSSDAGSNAADSSQSQKLLVFGQNSVDAQPTALVTDTEALAPARIVDSVAPAMSDRTDVRCTQSSENVVAIDLWTRRRGVSRERFQSELRACNEARMQLQHGQLVLGGERVFDLGPTADAVCIWHAPTASVENSQRLQRLLHSDRYLECLSKVATLGPAANNSRAQATRHCGRSAMSNYYNRVLIAPPVCESTLASQKKTKGDIDARPNRSICVLEWFTWHHHLVPATVVGSSAPCSQSNAVAETSTEDKATTEAIRRLFLKRLYAAKSGPTSKESEINLDLLAVHLTTPKAVSMDPMLFALLGDKAKAKAQAKACVSGVALWTLPDLGSLHVLLSERKHGAIEVVEVGVYR